MIRIVSDQTSAGFSAVSRDPAGAPLIIMPRARRRLDVELDALKQEMATQKQVYILAVTRYSGRVEARCSMS